MTVLRRVVALLFVAAAALGTTGLSISPTRFRPSKRGSLIAAKAPAKGGARVRLTLSEVSDARLAVERATTGRSVAGRCVKLTKKNRSRKRCTRFVAVASAERPGLQAGRSEFWLTGRRTSRKALAPGRYRLRVTPTDLAGNGGGPVAAPFTIKR